MKNWVDAKITEINEVQIWDKLIEEYKNQKLSMTESEFRRGYFFEVFHKLILPYLSWNGSEDNLIKQVYFYKKLLSLIKKSDESYYKDIHKGVPFYFIGWNSFLLHNYDDAIFYLDAALAEDKKNMPMETVINNGVLTYGWKDSAAALFFLLKSEYSGIYREFTTTKLKKLFLSLLGDFKAITSKEITLDDLRSKFITKLLEDINNTNTAIITTLSFAP